MLCILLQVLKAKQSTCFSHLRCILNKRSVLVAPQGSAKRTTERLHPRISLLEWILLTYKNWWRSCLPNSVWNIADLLIEIGPSKCIYAVELGTWIRDFSFFLEASLTVHHVSHPILPFLPSFLLPFHSPIPAWRALFQMKHSWETENLCLLRKIYVFIYLIREVPLQCFSEKCWKTMSSLAVHLWFMWPLFTKKVLKSLWNTALELTMKNPLSELQL